jgi:ribosomal protein S18 acetylase RimI-like enzyme
VIHYRTFRNPDPPLLADVWNASLAGPRTVLIQPRATGILEYFTLAKPYFDPQGLILALDENHPVGFVHAGFGPTADHRALDQSTGVICSLGVVPAHRRQGIGRELLHRAEEYLRDRGAQTILAGPVWPTNPFTFGLYGGSDTPGFVATDAFPRVFFERQGYQIARTIGILQRTLQRQQLPADPRFLTIHPRYDIIGSPLVRTTWWRECVLGPIEAVEYRLQDKKSSETAARLVLWDMATFSYAWGHTVVGLLDLEVQPELRRQGLAKHLVSQVLLHLYQQTFDRFEACVDLANAPALALLHHLGFEQVEIGHCFRRV